MSGVGAGILIQEARQGFFSLLHLFFLFPPFIKVEVLKFRRPRFLSGGHVEWWPKLVSDKLPGWQVLWPSSRRGAHTADCAHRGLEPPEASRLGSLWPGNGARMMAGRATLG